VTEGRPERILVVAPIGRDAELIARQLQGAGIACDTCTDVEALCRELVNGAGAVILTEEALTQNAAGTILAALADQPPWSEIPLIILTAALALEAKAHPFDALVKRTNVTLVDRPVRIKSLLSAVQSALRSRLRQYEVRDLMAQLEQRVNERDRFLAVLGHELRNPLGAILLASEMTDEEGKLDAESVRLVERQARHLTRLVNDLLDLSRVAAGKIVLKRQRLELADTVAQSVRTVLPLAQQHDIEIAVRTPAQRIAVLADPVRVDQIVTNLLTNAIKYTPEGGHVTVDLQEKGSTALIRVTDDGVGISPDRIGGIFELFAQAENAIGRAQGGMGIGLALVRDLTQLHGGTVMAQSEGEGEGSEFVVTLPLAIGDPIESEETAARPQGDGPGVPRRIAIVEDNKDVRDLLRLKLRRLGHDVIDAANGIDGLRLVLDERPDLALVDLGLPGIDGFELARRARASVGEEIVLVAVSGFGQPEDKRRALEAGFDEHLTKPADVKDIENLLLRLPPRTGERDDSSDGRNRGEPHGRARGGSL
jgi:signal transduction histidine kinase/ActR/RegA family two-component response regulator